MVVASVAFVLVATGAVLFVSRRSPRRTSVAVPTTTTTSTSVAPLVTEALTTAPATSTTTSAPAAPLDGKVIVIDPGHNEHNAQHTAEINQPVDVITETKECDTTGTATNDGYTEAAYNTDVATRVAAILRARGATVVLTRGPQTPWGPCVTERARIGNDAHADAAVSIHADGGPASGRGFHVIEPGLVAGHNDAIIDPSHRLALVLRDTFRDETPMPTSNYLGQNGIDRRTDLGGLNLSTVPKVFIETGNMRNATDAQLLETDAFRQRAAQAIADALTTFVTTG